MGHVPVRRQGKVKRRFNAIGDFMFSQRATTRLASFNTRTLTAQWKQNELMAYLEQQRIALCAIQEHRIVHKEEVRDLQLAGGWRLVTSSADAAGVGGVGFALSPKASKTLSRSIAVSPRILWLQFIGAASVNSSQVKSQVKSVKTHVISVYSPTNTAETSTKKAFYDQLSACISSIAKRDPLYILGDFNAKLDHSSAPFPVHKLPNENGELLAEFMDDLGLFSVLCSLRKPRSQWFTHCGPNGHKSRIDHCLARKKYKSSALNIRLMTPATVTSDHRLLRVEVRLRFAAHTTKAPQMKPDWEALRDPDMAEAVVSEVKSKLGHHKDTVDYKLFAKAATDACREHLPTVQVRKRKKPWVDQDICVARDVVSTARHQHRVLRTAQTRTKLAEAAQNLSNIYTRKQEEYFSKLADEVEQEAIEGRHAAAWATINTITGRKRPQKYIIPADSPQDRVNQWRDHFQQLLTAADPTEPFISQSIAAEELDIDTGSITIAELQVAARTLRNRKCPGLDGISPELLKLTGIQEIILPILNQALDTGQTPQEWRQSGLLPLYKKGDTSCCANYRGISLMSLVGKLYNKVLLNRIRGKVEPLLRYNQNGFRPGRSTVQHVLSLRKILEQCRVRQNCNCVAVFVDFSKAFDSISRARMELILPSYGIPRKIVKAIMSMYSCTSATVFTSDGQSDPFDITAGVLQGDTLSPFLFVIVVDYIMRLTVPDSSVGFRWKRHEGSRRPAGHIADLDYADDIVLLASSINNAQQLLTALETNAKIVGLRINTTKTEFMLAGDFCEEPVLKTSNGPIKRVDDFRYLGCWMRDSRKDFLVRRAQAFDAANKMWRVWKSDISRNLKIRLFRVTVESVLLYGSETWCMTIWLKKRLDGAYTRLLQKALNISWKLRVPNAELYGGMPRPSTLVTKRRLQLAGHCFRASGTQYQPASDLVFWQSHERFRVGQGNSLTYNRMLRRDTGLELDELQKVALNRDEWRTLCHRST